MRSATSGASGARPPSSSVKGVAERWRPWLAAAVLVAGVTAFAVVKFTGPNASPPHRASKLSAEEARVVYAFLDTAVAREHLDRAWGIVTPELRQGMSLAEWETGTIPVVPYPVREANVGMTTVESFTDTAHLDVKFSPFAGSVARPATFALDLRKVNGKWLVASWAPTSVVAAHKGK